MRYIPSILSLCTLAGLLSGCHSEEGPKLNGGTRSNVLEVDYVVVQPQPMLHNIQVTGSLIPGESAQLTTQAAGKVQSISFEEGEKVKKGQVLVRIDSREWDAQLQRYRAELKNANKDLERKKAMASVQGISEAELEAAELKTQTLKANIRETQVKLDHATITAPFDGKIGLRSVSPGSYISAGTPVAMLVQENPLKLQFNVPERYAALLRPGQEVNFSIADNDTVYQASVYATEPMISESTRALRVRAKANNPAGKLIPGSYADVTVELDSIPDALMIPTEAIVPQLNNQLVYRISKGKAEQVQVKTGVREPRKVQITSGLQAGDTVLVSGLLQVRPGMPVKGDQEIDVKSFESN